MSGGFMVREIEPDLIDTVRVAQMLGVKRRTIEDWIYDQRKNYTPDPLPLVKVGRLNRFPPKAVEAWWKRRMVSTVEYGEASE